MNEISRWFESFGVSPLFAGIIIGAIVMFLLTRRSDRNVKPLGAAPEVPDVARGASRKNIVSGPLTQIRIQNNGQPIELSPEVSEKIMSLLKSGNKIEAIKVLREATGLGLAESKHMAEAIERGAIER